MKVCEINHGLLSALDQKNKEGRLVCNSFRFITKKKNGNRYFNIRYVTCQTLSNETNKCLENKVTEMERSRTNKKYKRLVQNCKKLRNLFIYLFIYLFILCAQLMA
jgi:hypothetical protein